MAEGHAWQGGVWWGGHAWQERRPLQRTVRILLECILVSRKKLNSLCFVDIRSTTEIYIFHKRSFSREHLIIRVHCSKIFLLIFTWDSNLVFCYLMSTFLGLYHTDWTTSEKYNRFQHLMLFALHRFIVTTPKLYFCQIIIIASKIINFFCAGKISMSW